MLVVNNLSTEPYFKKYAQSLVRLLLIDPFTLVTSALVMSVLLCNQHKLQMN